MKIRFHAIIILFFILFTMFSYLYFSNNSEAQSNNVFNDPFYSNEITMSFVGDILLASGVEKKINQEGYNYPFEKVFSYLASSDYAMGNLECSISSIGYPIMKKQFNFRADPSVLKSLQCSGIKIFSVANNHSLDYGYDAFRETAKNLKNINYSYVGAGENQKEALAPACFEKNGKKIAFIAASHVLESESLLSATDTAPGIAEAYTPEELIASVKNTKMKNDIVIVYLHWGKEREILPEDYQRSLGELLIDNGADIVVGSHPHVLQGFEYYKGKLIAYSLGNFVFTDNKKDTLILTVTFDGTSIKSVKAIPCEINAFRPEPVEDYDQKLNFYKMIESRSFNIHVDNGQLIENTNLTE